MLSSENEIPWYSSGLSFECTQCGRCCSGPGTGFVWVTDEEIESIAKCMGMESDIDAFERKFVRRIGVKTSLVEYSDGDCIFLDPKTRTCSVYEARPRQCRTWPFWDSNLKSPKTWGKTAESCPGCNRGRVYTIDEIHERIDNP
jgi:uncharacterized protein